MKLEGYEIVNSFAIPAYWYEEGEESEHYWVDYQNLVYHKFIIDTNELGLIDNKDNPIKDENGVEKKDERKWWIILPYKPKGVKVTEKNEEEVVKWLVGECYLDDENANYEFYEWDFDKHCIIV